MTDSNKERTMDTTDILFQTSCGDHHGSNFLDEIDAFTWARATAAELREAAYVWTERWDETLGRFARLQSREWRVSVDGTVTEVTKAQS